MSNKTELTRRGALASLGATAVIAASPALAASSIPTTATTETVAVVWPAYHRAGPDHPRSGESVILRADSEPYMRPALGIYSERGLKLGYVAPRKAEKLLSAMDKGAQLEARIAAKRDDAASGTDASGWHISTLSVTTVAPRGALAA